MAKIYVWENSLDGRLIGTYSQNPSSGDAYYTLDGSNEGLSLEPEDTQFCVHKNISGQVMSVADKRYETVIESFFLDSTGDSSYDMSGEFHYYGIEYIHNRNTSEKTYKYIYVWTNGKTYVGSDTRLYETGVYKLYDSTGQDDVKWKPGLILSYVDSNTSAYMTNESFSTREVSNVRYNRPGIYLNWDGETYDSVYEDQPLYTLDVLKTRGPIENAKIYVNGKYRYTLECCRNIISVGGGLSSNCQCGLYFIPDEHGKLAEFGYVDFDCFAT